MAFRPRQIFIAFLITLEVLSGCRGPRSDNRRRYATRTGDIVTLHPIPVSFQIPREWLDWDLQYHRNLHLSRPELITVENGAGEWDSEYAAVINAALPFSDCAAHLGAEQWGKEGVSFGDIQLRAYITDLPAAEVLSRLSGPAMHVARKVAYSPSKNDALAALMEPEFTDEGVQGGWRRAEILYRLWYHDYGGLARIRVYLRRVQKHTLVLVFMGGPESQVKEVVNSVTINSEHAH